MARRRFGRRGVRRRARQGITSWLTSIVALIIGLFPVWRNLANLINGRMDIGTFASDTSQFYNPFAGNREALKVGYGSLVGGLIFKVVTSELTKRARIRSIVPALRA